jgi:hypothetical protein
VSEVITIRQVVTAWGRDTESGSRAAVTRLRYRARGNDWGHPGAQKPALRLAHPALSGAQLAVAGICIRLIAVHKSDEVYLVVPESVAALIREIRETERADWVPDGVRDAFEAALPLLRRASIEVRDRRSLRHLHRLVAGSQPDSSFQSLETAAAQIHASMAKGTVRPVPVSVTDPGWTCDWGYSRKYQGAAIGLTRTSGDGSTVGVPLVTAVPTPPDLTDGELAAVLLTNAYASAMGEDCLVVYSDSRDTASHLRSFIASGRPATHGALLPRLAAPFSDEQLLAIDVRWIYRHSTPSHRDADVAARHMSRGEPVPEESVVELEWLLRRIS